MSKQKIAVITGASQGIGRAIALDFAQQGYQTILVARCKQKLSAVADEITRAHPALQPDIFAVDIQQQENIAALINAVQEKYQRIDVLVNNAGIWLSGSSGVDKDEVMSLLATNFLAPYLFMDFVLPIMKQQQSGYIINISSRSGKIGFAGSGLYSASKFGLTGLSEALYKELAPFGIKLSSICPSWVNTNMARQANSPLAAQEMIQCADVVASIRYLLSLSSSACVKELVLECKKTL